MTTLRQKPQMGQWEEERLCRLPSRILADPHLHSRRITAGDPVSLNLGKRTIEYLQQHPQIQYTAREIAEWVFASYPLA